MHKWTAVETVSSGWFFRVCEEKQALPVSALCQNELGSKSNTPENVISRFRGFVVSLSFVSITPRCLLQHRMQPYGRLHG